MEDDERGTIDLAKRADLIMPDENPLTMEASRVTDVEPGMTISGGKVV